MKISSSMKVDTCGSREIIFSMCTHMTFASVPQQQHNIIMREKEREYDFLFLIAGCIKHSITYHRLEFFQAVLVCLDKVQTHFFLGQKTFGFLICFSKNLWFFDIYFAKPSNYSSTHTSSLPL